MSSSAIEITERLLSDAGGWQALKAARGLVTQGRVTGATYSPPLLKGLVRDGGKEFRAGLRIVTRTNIENLCSCRAAREWGSVCAHSLAVGLALIQPQAPSTKLTAPTAPASTKPETGGPFFSTPDGAERIHLHVILSPQFQTAWEKDAITVGIEVEQAGRHVLIHALDKTKTFSCSSEDAQLLEKLRTLNGGALAGMLILPREKCMDLLETLRGHPRVTFGKGARVDVAELLRTLRPQTSGAALDNQAGMPEASAQELPKPTFSLALEGSLNFLTGRLQAHYEALAVTVGSANDVTVSSPGRGDAQRRVTRNIPAENEALHRLTRWGFARPDAAGNVVLKNEHAILNFFAVEFPRLQREWAVSVGARFSNVTREVARFKPRIEIRSSGENWFDLSVTLPTSGGDTISGAEVQRLLQAGQNHVRLKNNRVAVFDGAMLDEFQKVLRDCDPAQTRPGTYRLQRIHAGYLDAVIGNDADVSAPPSWLSWAQAHRHLEKMEPVPLGALEDVLRPYQKHGVYWMSFLAKNRFGGILADEMGLGKTLQALGFLQTAIGTSGAPSLVICPSSLMQNWIREASRFTPQLRTLLVAGPTRDALFDEIPKADLVITSYPLLRRDSEKYRRFAFRAVILDEAQHIKNPETQNAQAATQLKADHRFVLTGTPVENSVRDLWSIMNFILPGYLGRSTEFREQYEEPISRGDSDALQRFSKRLRPFLLRRLKREVVTELPDKIEQVVLCDLTTQQREIYEKVLVEARRQVHELSPGESMQKKRALMLTALLRLRQACCDARLLRLGTSGTGDPSGKLQALDELLREAMDGGHRVLIFSQFVTMLDLIRQELDAASVAYCYLAGATKDRMTEVDRFQSEAGISVFLISLKAGGVGLNLTAADTVIHFDPWWNPAAEAQATDRAHRIGQQNLVVSYKLIAKNTIEEKILNLQKTKEATIRGVLEGTQSGVGSLTTDEIEALLRSST